MGLDVAIQAIPTDSRLLALARDDLERGDELGLIGCWFGRDDGPVAGDEGGGDRDAGALWDECCRLDAIRPDLRRLHCSLGRSWDALHYLLSATRREESAADADRTIDHAFGGGDPIADHVSGGQGILIRFLTPDIVADIAAVVGPMDRDALARHYDPRRMEAAAVYKFWADCADPTSWEYLVGYFMEFRRVFMAAARNGDGMIVCMD